MGEEKSYKIDIARPAKNLYQQRILPYIYDNFSFGRADEVAENILRTVGTLCKKPSRGSKERHLLEAREDFKFILHKETKHFEIKIIYFVDEENGIVNVTDFFPTKMSPQRIIDNN